MSTGNYVFGRVSVAVVTPFLDVLIDKNQTIDEKAVIEIVNHVAIGLAASRRKFGLVGGIIISGTTGEQHTMTITERTALYMLAVAAAQRHKVPIIAGIAATTTAGVMELANSALESGCEGIMLGLPPYCRLCDEEIRSYIMSVRILLPDNFPILLYNNAMRNGYGPSLSLVAELCRDGTLWGVKHAVAPDVFLSQAVQLLELEPSMRLYTGSDKLSAEVLDYSKELTSASPLFYGLTSIAGNLFPGEVATMASLLALSPVLTEEDSLSPAESARMGKELHARLLPVVDATLLGCSLPAGLKYALRSRGLAGGHPRLPVGFLSAEKKAEIDEALRVYDGIEN